MLDPLRSRKMLPLPPILPITWMGQEKRAEPDHEVVPLPRRPDGRLARIVVTKLVGMTTHDPVIDPKTPHDLLVDYPAQAVIRLMWDPTIAFMDIDQRAPEGLGRALSDIARGPIKTDHRVAKFQLGFARVPEDSVIFLGNH
jgi:hypothetical protein